MTKIIHQNRIAREKLVKGSNLLAEVVGSTLGPTGNNVSIDQGYEVITIHDGVKVAREVELEDPAENAGVRILRQAANKQVQEVGDGTTVVTILGDALITECHEVISAGTNAMLLRKGLEEGQRKLLDKLSSIAIPVKTLEEKVQIATISAEDQDLGKMIGETIDKIGTDGIITVEESKLPDTYIETQEGMQFDHGYISPYFITDTDRMEATVEDTYILITDMVVSNIQELLPLLNGENGVGKVSKNLVIIAQDVTDSALASMIATKMNGGMNVNCVKAPYVGQKMKDFLADIAILTGGKVITEDAGNRFEHATITDLGKAHRITSTIDATLIVGGYGKKEDITARVSSLKELQKRKEGSDWEQERLRERIGKLTNGIAVLYVGGETEGEMKERKERADDAIHATQAAALEGIVPGGEVVYLTIRDVLDQANVAERILYKALERPFKKLVENAGYDGGQVIAELKYQQAVNELTNGGFDVTDGEFKDLIDAGIIDPAMVSKFAIRNAVSVAVQVMSTNTVIANKPDDKTKQN